VFSGDVAAGHPRIAMLKTSETWLLANRLRRGPYVTLVSWMIWRMLQNI
jgi:hypothetical protein